MVIYWKEIVHNVNFRNIFQYHWNKWGVIFCKELWKNKFLYIYDDHDRLGKWFFFAKINWKLIWWPLKKEVVIYWENILKLILILHLYYTSLHFIISDKRKFYVIRKDEKDLESIDYSSCSFPTYLNIINKTWIKPLITIQLIHGM